MWSSGITIAVLAPDELEAHRTARQLHGTKGTIIVGTRDSFDPAALEADVIVLAARDLADPGFVALYELMRLWSHTVPVLLCTLPDTANLRRLVQLSVTDLYLLTVEERSLDEAVHAVSREHRFLRLSRSLEDLRDLPPLCRRGLQRICRQHPPDVTEAVERAARGETVFVRTVSELAAMLRCSPAYLSRATQPCGFRLGDFIRWVTFLRGISLHTPGSTWWEVSTRLGFGCPAAWTSFVRRLINTTPTEVARQPARVWWQKFARVHGLEQQMFGS